jgi:curved DNA-binding protein CbpA
MDHYEEFGLSSSATTEEIRSAYRRLVRLFHPDQLQDPELRRLAECQMKRLNAIYEVLSDPDKRRAYDLALAQATLETRAAQRVIPEQVRRGISLRRNAPWAAAAAAALIVLYGWLTQLPDRDLDRVRAVTSGAPGSAFSGGAPVSQSVPGKPSRTREEREVRRRTAAELERLRQVLADAEAQRDAARAELARLSRTHLAAHSHDASGAGEPFEPPPTVTHPTPRDGIEPPAPTASSTHGLAGAWFYVPQTIDFASRDLYPPEYIDLVITEDQGMVRGRYRGRYRVPDRAISPEVDFRFEGQVNEEGLYPWFGRGGARGEVRLRLISPETLQVVWLASDLGRQMGLGSGTAVLVRQRRSERP